MNTWIKSSLGLVCIAGTMLLFATGCDEHKRHRYLGYRRSRSYYVPAPYRIEHRPAVRRRIIAPTRRRDHGRGHAKGAIGVRRLQRSPSRKFQSATPRKRQSRRGNLKERRKNVSTRGRAKRTIGSSRAKQSSSRKLRSAAPRRGRSRRGNPRSNLSLAGRETRRPRGAHTTSGRQRNRRNFSHRKLRLR